MDFTVATGVGTFTVVNAFTAQIAISITFRLHRAPPTEKLRALSAVLGEIHDILPRIVVEEMLVGELLRNGKMEQWRANLPYDWDTVTGTITRETTILYQGGSSLKLATASASVRQRIPLEYGVNGKTLVLTGYIYGKITNGPKIGITANGSTTYSAAVAADDTWEQLTLELAITSGTQPIYVMLSKGSAADVAYFDALSLTVMTTGVTSLVPISTAFQDVRQIVRRQGAGLPAPVIVAPSERVYDNYAHYTAIEGDYLLVGDYIAIVGIGVWPTLSALTDTVDITVDDEPLVVLRAGLKLMKVLQAMEHLSDTAHWKQVEADLQREEPQLKMLQRSAPTKHLPIPVR